jgi:glycosyl transferase family 1
MDALLLSRYSDLPWYDWGFLYAFARRGVNLLFVPEHVKAGATLQEILSVIPERPSLILGTEWGGFPLPEGLTEVDIPTLTLQEDTFAFTHRRIRWSMLFDYVVVFHAGCEQKFRDAGHTRVYTMPWAVLSELYDRPEQERNYDLGWVGRPSGESYQARRRILDTLQGQFRTNDFWEQGKLTQQEMASIYVRSRVVVNVCRDDFPFEANTRMFETMAAGALLVVRDRNEISDLGFEEGTHFVAYRDEAEIVPLVRRYLNDETARRRIANAAREKVLREHTYDARVVEIQALLESDGGRLPAPARHWPEHRVRLTYLDYHAAYGRLDLACRQWPRVARRSLRGGLTGAALMAGAWSRRWR